MGLLGPLPDPEWIGSHGYICCDDFDPPLPEVHPNAPSIWIDPVAWLKYTLSYFAVEGFTHEAHPVGHDGAWAGHIQFTIPNSKDAGRPLHIAAVGEIASRESLAFKYAVVEALKLLAPFGYIIPSYTSMIVEVMNQQGLFYDVEAYCLSKAQANTTSLVERYAMTYAGCSFQATLRQVMEKCQHDWKYAYEFPRLTSKGYQDKLVASPKGSSGAPCFTVVSRPCRTAAEATESVLCTALTCVHQDYGYIGDLNFVDFIIRRTQLLN